VLFGTASVLLLYLIASLLYQGWRVPLISALLLAMDPLHAYFSRTTYIEIPDICFFLLYLYLMLEYSENNRRTLPIAGVALGLTIATKAYYIVAIPLVAAYAFQRAWQRGDRLPSLAFDFSVTLLILPVSIYLLSYFQWFGRGHSLPEFVQMQQDAVWMLQSYTPGTFEYGWYLKAGGQPWEWFLKPLIFGHQLSLDGETGRFLLQINNPPVRLLVIPSILVISVYAWKKREVRELPVPLLFIACYLVFLLVKRQMFSYSALVALPFAYLAVARAVSLLSQWYGKEKQVCAAFIGGAIVWGFYLLPLISGHEVPLVLYRPILSIAKLVGMS
jgi:dolichyl-phosphate-mannose--protein O-mannosyl transferase